jgi:hypothetical protein
MTSFEISHYFTLKSSMHHISNLLFLGLLLFTVVTLGLLAARKFKFAIPSLIITFAFVIGVYVVPTLPQNTVSKNDIFASPYFQTLSSEQKESFKLELVQSNGGKDNNEISLIKLRAVIDKFQSMK